MADMKAQSNVEIVANIKQCYEQKDKLKEIEHERMQTTVEERRVLMEEKLCEFLGIN